MPNATLWEKTIAILRTRKQTKQIDRVEVAVEKRKQARLELEQAIRDLSIARAGKHVNHGSN